MALRLLALLLLCGCAPEPVVVPPPPVHGDLACGVIDRPCDCNGTIAYNWKISPSVKCASGLHMLYQCEAKCLGGGWESACFCDVN